MNNKEVVEEIMLTSSQSLIDKIKEEVVKLSMEEAGITKYTRLKELVKRSIHISVAIVAIASFFILTISLLIDYEIVKADRDLSSLLNITKSIIAYCLSVVGLLSTFDKFPFSYIDVEKYRIFYHKSLLKIINDSKCPESIKIEMRNIVELDFYILYREKGKEACDEKLLEYIEKIVNIKGFECLFRR